MASDFVRSMLIERRKRLVGSVMVYLERQVYPKLSKPEQAQLRDKIMVEVGAYHDVCLDILKASVDDGTIIVNEEALRLLQDIHGKVV